MSIRILVLVMALLGLGFGSAQALPLDGQQTYDLLFREGTLDSVSRDRELVYEREVQSRLNPDAEQRDTGQIALRIEQSDPAEEAALEFRQDGGHRGLGSFPASVGNPMIMYFYEITVRDMAEAAGGSPFYIRNRVKEALIKPNEVEIGSALFAGETIETQVVRIRPFADDPNRARMQGFGDLELRVTMSEDVPGWYLSLVAEAEGVYRSELRFDGAEVLQ